MLGLLVGYLAGRALRDMDTGAAIQAALDDQHDEDTMLLSCGIEHPTALQRYIARMFGRGITAEWRNRTWVCEECRMPWDNPTTLRDATHGRCHNCGNKTRITTQTSRSGR